MKKAVYFLLVIPFLASCTGGGNQDFSSLKTDYFLGDAAAKVTIEEYADYQCPACQFVHNNVLPDIKKNLIDTGKAKYIFRDFPLESHEHAHKAAQSTYCAGEQDKYWEMQDTIFKNQDTLTEDNLKKFAEGLGLDMSLFEPCLDSGRYKSFIDASVEEGDERGVRATPTLFLNGKKLEGILGYEDLQKLIDDLE